MMDPRKYDELLAQEDHYCELYDFKIRLRLTTTCDNKYYCSDAKLHHAVMTITGGGYTVRDNSVLRSDEDGVFYTQIGAMVNVRQKLVAFFKEMEDKGYMSYENECRYISGEDLEDVSFSGPSLEDQEYVNWLSRRRREFAMRQIDLQLQ
ncbi:hypothetical protein SBOR_8576 [Sclerotinia borealis F-4128]|uniref:Uncharacterized protein n=1 Tax=Sclerotinia borealis (strain F-4128) TaxID=1432307 RepID=W9C840_SCLBF|nr:hypothetical protein SBOR_8576 [Sclerotinia borealis F-4128]